ncbi:MAG TPA: glycoside hydrolase family 3 C-terminal domain-containing protein, partial [Bryobacteraceae bacterium]|nr:glycoside hydrolase family 3 C-terminal domain-containing protein [Bryobacteraceae bacterium]
ILEAWYPGESGGQAIAETVSGKNNPGGRLPITFYSSVNQLPPFDDYSMKGRTYRFFGGHPLFGFGTGLSYTEFAYSSLHISSREIRAGDTLTVEADVQNVGPVRGDEVVELYLKPPTGVERGAVSLRGFTRVSLDPAANRHIRFELSEDGLSEVREDGLRAVLPGSYEISIGGSQPVPGSNNLTAEFTISGLKSLGR